MYHLFFSEMKFSGVFVIMHFSTLLLCNIMAAQSLDKKEPGCCFVFVSYIISLSFFTKEVLNNINPKQLSKFARLDGFVLHMHTHAKITKLQNCMYHVKRTLCFHVFFLISYLQTGILISSM